MPTTHPFSWIGLAFSVLFTVMFLGQAWINLVNQRVSKFSIDGLLLAILQQIGSNKSKRNARNFPRAKWEIITVGIWALLAALKGIQEIAVRINALNR